MKTIQNTIALALGGIVLAACGGQAPEATTPVVDTKLNGVYSVDAANSVVNWEGNMLEIGGISLYSHNGTINVLEGEIVAENGKVVGGSIVIDMTTIRPTDNNYSEDRPSSDLVQHLSSDDFFAVEQYPTALYEITTSEDGKVEGKLTLRGNTNTVAAQEVNIAENENGVLNAAGKVTFDRQQFDAKFAMPVQDKVLSDNIKLSFDVKANKNADA